MKSHLVIILAASLLLVPIIYINTKTSYTHLTLSQQIKLTKKQVNPLLSDWMGNLQPIIGEISILDLSLPGTHNSFTYDLSHIYADRVDDISLKISFLMHNFISNLYTFGDFGRTQSQCQSLTIKEQLDNGVRYLDMRAIYTQTGVKSLTSDWYSFHFMQTTHKLIELCKDVREWIDEHPTEIIMIEITYHGTSCDDSGDAYPMTNTKEKRKFWDKFQTLFKDVLYNTQLHKPLNETSVNQLIKQNSRVIVYTSDYPNFTGSSPFAQNGCQVDTWRDSHINEEKQAFESELEFFSQVSELKKKAKKQNKLVNKSLLTSGDTVEIVYAFEQRYLNQDQRFDNITEITYQECLKLFKIPENTHCPETLMDLGQWTNYYKQTTLEIVRQRGDEFPNALFVDQLDWDGTIRTGTNTNIEDESAVQINQNLGSIDTQNSKFAYVGTVLLANLNLKCEKGKENQECNNMRKQINENINKYPAQRWNDPSNGRLKNWPQPF